MIIKWCLPRNETIGLLSNSKLFATCSRGRMVAAPPPRGIYVPVPTFFVSRSASNFNSSAPPLDLTTQAKHAIHLARCGIRGLVVLGSTGEAIMITNSERKTLFKHLREELERAGFKDYPIIAGTATQSIADTVQVLKESKEAGSSWGLVLAPGYFAPMVSQEGLVEWYSAIADQSSIPIMMWVCQSTAGPVSSTALMVRWQIPLPCRLKQHRHRHTHVRKAGSPS